jgi:hypothetical protein
MRRTYPRPPNKTGGADASRSGFHAQPAKYDPSTAADDLEVMLGQKKVYAQTGALGRVLMGRHTVTEGSPRSWP